MPTDEELVEIGMRIVNDLLDNPPQPKTCDTCGSELVWVDCWLCGGDGEYDETETDPLEGDPLAVCHECNGAGGWLECPDVPHNAERMEA